MPALSSAMRKAYEGKARSAISSLEVAISMYETDMGYFPIVEGTSNPDVNTIEERNQLLVNALADMANTNDPNWRGPYMEFKAKELRDPGDLTEREEIPDAVFVDPWDNPYIYIPYHKYGEASVNPYAAKPYPTAGKPFYNLSSYQIFSKGSDGETAGNGTYRAGCTVPKSDGADDNDDDINNWE